MNTAELLNGYDPTQLSVGALGGHSALDVLHGAHRHGLRTVAVTQEGRERTYQRHQVNGERGCIDELITLPKFADVLNNDAQERLRSLHTIFVHSRYFWVYFDDFSKVEQEFRVPIFGARTLLKLEERDQPYNQYHLLKDAGVRTPIIYAKPEDIDRPVMVKVSEAQRRYERAFFIAVNEEHYRREAEEKISAGQITREALEAATIEELVVGAHVNFNFFYSPLTGELELLGTDMRRQTNLDGLLRMPAEQQNYVLQMARVPVKMIETGHVAVTVKESLLEKAYALGEQFVEATKKLSPELDPSQKGLFGPFALQGAVVAEEGKEDIVIFDVSLRIPGSPGIAATPYSSYLYGQPMSMGERVAVELRRAADEGRLEEVVT